MDIDDMGMDVNEIAYGYEGSQGGGKHVPPQVQHMASGSGANVNTSHGNHSAISENLPSQESTAPALDTPGRPVHVRRIPHAICDMLPEGTGPMLEHQPTPEHEPTPEPPPSGITRVILRVREAITSKMNSFGLSRVYPRHPGSIPDENVDINDLSDIPSSDTTKSKAKDLAATVPDLGIYPNVSTLIFLHWFWNSGAVKSVGDRDRLVNDVFHSLEGFNPRDVNVSELHKLDAQLAGQGSTPVMDDGWIETTVKISVPDGIGRSGGEKDAPTFEVPHFYYRKLTSVLRSAFEAPQAERFHFTPFKQFWKPPGASESQRVYDEVYCTDAFLEADEEIQRLQPEPGCKLPRAVAGFMFSSDGLQLSNFGDASLWPGYAAFANQSKWERGKPSSQGIHTFAHFPKVSITFLPSPVYYLCISGSQLPDKIQDFLASLPASARKKVVLTHCKRELMQGCWAILLDDDFLEAYVHGIVVVCGDGIARRLYPRILIYSADYPEK